MLGLATHLPIQYKDTVMSNGPYGRRVVVLLVVVGVVVAGSAATGALGALQEPTGEEVLDRVDQRYDSAETMTTTVEITVENDTMSETMTVEVAAAENNRTRVIVDRDGTTYRAGTNGTVAWSVTPDRSVAWRIDGAAGDRATAPGASVDGEFPGEGDKQLSQTGVPELNESNVSATVVGTPTVDGTTTYEVELTHPEASGTTTLWVAQDDYRVVRMVATDGTNRTEMDVQSTSFNVSIHESTFEPPADRTALSTVDSYEAFDAAQSATDLSLPTPEATFAEATVLVRQGETVVSQRYVADGENVTVLSTTAEDRFDRLTQNATKTEVNGQTVYVVESEGTAIATWRTDGVTTAVIVEGSTDRATEFAGQL